MKNKKRMPYMMGGEKRSAYMGGGYAPKRNMMSEGGVVRDYNSIMEMEAGQMSPDHNESMKKK
jgi:hypothetical protein